MSIKVSGAVYESDVSPVNKRALLLALADNANDGGLCKPGVAYLVGKTTIPRSTVFRLMKQLEAENLLERRARRRANGSRRSSAYRINLEELARRRRIVTTEEVDELAALFDDDPTDIDEGLESPSDMHGPGAGPCEPDGDESPGESHSPGAGPSDHIVPERDGGSPGAGRAGGPGAGPLEPSYEPLGGTGAPVPGDRPAGEPVQGPNAPTLLTPQPGRPETWKCARHLAAPDPLDGPCGPCREVRVRCEARQAEIDAAAARSALSVEGVGRACQVCTADGPARDGSTRWVVARPGTQVPLTPYRRCEHDRSFEDVVADIEREEAEADAARAARPAGLPVVASEEARAAAVAAVRRSCRAPTPKPTRRVRGASVAGPPVPEGTPGTDGQEAAESAPAQVEHAAASA